MKQIEIEYKTLLNRTEFDQLTAHFSYVPIFKQTNYYFDTPNRALRQAKLSLRIRTLADRAELTLKIPQDIGNLEHNLDLSLEEAQAMIAKNRLEINPLTQLLIDRGFDLDEIGCLGFLTTYRREVKLPIGLLALDENHYAEQIDYELELEVTDPEAGQQAFQKFLKDQKIAFKYAQSKVVRFLKTLP
ncbi:CYTH domain-containing protein [Streptococcus ovuberis]|uniref:CYTH domain-containing protein n=1 Tax=Streptococcus ovuberis TaxID=1936207 RepID=A0A7X6MYS8_9STRE|nr:CYTH domain-containing protein [Streptococcus ovuberis]NKZ20920.1 CYTH domain-containing protein [Streptococcus ovuberis]